MHGRVFPVELIAAAMEGSAADAQSALNECRHKGFIVDAPQPAGCMQFRQELVLQAVLKGISETDLRHIHGRLAEALEQGLPSGDAHPAEALARHFLGAGRSRKAATYFSVSAERLASKSAFIAAVEAYRRAIELTQEEILRTPGTADGAWSLVLALACKLAPIEGVVAPAKALELLDDVLNKTPDKVEGKVRAETLRHKGLLELKLSRPVEAEDSLTEAQRLWGDNATAEQRAGLEAELASVREARGDYPGATHLLLEALKRIAGAKLTDRDLLWRVLNQLGRVHLRIGEAVKAREFFENARAQAQKARSTIGEVRALTNLAGALGTQGDVAGAEKTFLSALQLAQGVGDRIDVARIEFNLGRLCMGAGRRDEAKVRLESALEQSNLVSWREGVASATQALEALRTLKQSAPTENGTRSLRAR